MMSFDQMWQGTLVVMCSTAREAEEMSRHFHDQAIMIHGQRTTVQALTAEVAARGGQPRVQGGLPPPYNQQSQGSRPELTADLPRYLLFESSGGVGYARRAFDI